MIFPRYTFVKGVLLFSTYITGTANSQTYQAKLPDLSLISTLFSMFLKPYLKSLQTQPNFRSFDDSVVEKAVRKKLQQLKTLLQDNDINYPEMEDTDKFTFEGNDETTIIEFIPQPNKEPMKHLRGGNDTFKYNIRRYKKIRTKIDNALEKESVSGKTKKLVLKTLDELISKMVETQCNWKGGTQSDTHNNSDRFVVPRKIFRAWNTEWHKFNENFSTLINHRANEPVKNMDNLISHLNSMNNIIKDLSNNIEMFTTKYKITCNVSKRRENKKSHSSNNALRMATTVTDEPDDDKPTCNQFKVCSTELKSFFLDFYNSLNETAINVIRNYGEMFTRDVYTDASNEKDNIVTLIFNIADIVENETINIFAHDTSQFNLDENKNKEANIKLLTEYIKRTISNLKQKVDDVSEAELKNIPKKVYSNIRQDLNVNLGVDLGNLERHMISKICLIFNVCDGSFKSRRFYGKDSNIDENKIYVNVELTLEDDVRDKMWANSFRRTQKLDYRNFMKGMGSSYNPKVTTEIVTTKLFNFGKYTNITVTRTTLV